MKKIISLLLFVAIALIGFGVIAPDKMPVDGKTKDLLYSMNEKSTYIVDGIKKVAQDIGATAKAVGKVAVVKAKEGIEELKDNNKNASNDNGDGVKLAKSEIQNTDAKLSTNKVTNTKADVIAFKIHNNPNDNISLDKEIASARARYNAKNNVASEITSKKIISPENTAKKIINEQKDNEPTNSSVNINFPFNSSELTKTAIDKLKAIKLGSNSKISIIGHTDSTGSNEANQYYSKARAMSVKQFFVDSGVNEENISIKYSAASNPTASNSTLIGRRANRRVEISIAK